LIFTLLLTLTACKGPSAVDTGTCSTAEMDLNYVRYVEPFVSGAVESSCSQCHMTGIDIGMYTQDTPCQTLACMVDAGVVNLDNPAESELLDLIRKGETASSVFDVEKEAEAFQDWIEWSSDCHEQACGVLESPCTSGSGAASTGVDPLGDCGELNLLASFWDALIIDRKRCNTCHSQWAEDNTTFGACTTDDDCSDDKLECLAGFCKMPGAYYAPHFFEGLEEEAKWSSEADKLQALNSLYNIVSLGLLNTDTPLSSLLLSKPLLDGFQPLAIYGPGVSMETVPTGDGVGVFHQGKSKFNFGYDQDQEPTSGVVDCRKETACEFDAACEPDYHCLIPDAHQSGWCRLDNSVCDENYVNLVRFVNYFSTCNSD
jgi:hypothetical protein